MSGKVRILRMRPSVEFRMPKRRAAMIAVPQPGK
jgi:hypothetical protein